MAEFCWEVAVMVAMPVAMAVIWPLVTVAMAGLVEIQMTSWRASAGWMVVVSVDCWSFWRVRVVRFREIDWTWISSSEAGSRPRASCSAEHPVRIIVIALIIIVYISIFFIFCPLFLARI